MNSCAGSRRTGFSSNVAGMVAAVHWMRATIGAPNLLVEHILGGGHRTLSSNPVTCNPLIRHWKSSFHQLLGDTF